MPKPEQPLKVLDDQYDKWRLYREIEFLHGRINNLLVSDLTAVDTDLKEDYATGELDSEAEIIAALNATNARINEIAEALNQVIVSVRLE